MLAVLSVVAGLGSCRPSAQTTADASTALDTVRLHEAKGFRIVHHASFTQVDVYDPWNHLELGRRYYLVRSDSVSTPSDGYRLRVPLTSMAIASCTHVGFADVLGHTDAITGCCSPELIYNRQVRDGAAQGRIMNLGDAFAIQTEALVGLRPQAIMVNGYGTKDEQTERLDQMGVIQIVNNEWIEQTPLARAEWVKFVAAFFCEEELADSLYDIVEQDYHRLAQAIASFDSPKPTVLSGNNFRGTWYLPSGTTYMGHLFHDAGADYRYAGDTTNGSLPLSVETIVREFSDADVWVGAPTQTLSQLRNQDQKHTLFRAYKTGRVYNFLLRSLPDGANDYWEQGVVRPDLILQDLAKIFYPDSLADRSFTFARQLEP